MTTSSTKAIALTLELTNKSLLVKKRAAMDKLVPLAKTASDECKRELCQNAELVPHLLTLIDHHPNRDSEDMSRGEVDFEERVLAVFGGLAACEDNQYDLYRIPGFMRCVESKLRSGASDELKWRAAWVVTNVLFEDANQRDAMRAHKQLVELVVRYAGRGGPTTDIRGLALSALVALASEPVNRRPLFEMPGVVDALVLALVRRESTLLEEEAVNAVANLAYNQLNIVDMQRNAKLVQQLQQSAEEGKSDKVRLHAKRALYYLGLSDEHVCEHGCCREDGGGGGGGGRKSKRGGAGAGKRPEEEDGALMQLPPPTSGKALLDLLQRFPTAISLPSSSSSPAAGAAPTAAKKKKKKTKEEEPAPVADESPSPPPPRCDSPPIQPINSFYALRLSD